MSARSHVSLTCRAQEMLAKRSLGSKLGVMSQLIKVANPGGYLAQPYSEEAQA